MHARRAIRLSTCLFLGALAAVVAWSAWGAHQLIHPSPENESLFLKSYSPESAVEPFKLDATSGIGSGAGDGAGTQCTSHSRDFDYSFVMRRGQESALMNAVAEDIARQLRVTGARITRRSGDALSHFDLSYAVGQSVGSITVQPTEQTVKRVTALATDREDAGIKIAIYEDWFVKVDHSSETAMPGLCR